MKLNRRHEQDMKLKGKLSISRCSDGSIHISIEDELSGLELVEARVTPEVFGNAVTGLSYQECEMEVQKDHLAKLGMKRESKTEIVEFKSRTYDRVNEQPRAKLALKPFEVNGWMGRVDDMFNHQNATGKDSYRVHFVRWV